MVYIVQHSFIINIKYRNKFWFHVSYRSTACYDIENDNIHYGKGRNQSRNDNPIDLLGIS